MPDEVLDETMEEALEETLSDAALEETEAQKEAPRSDAAVLDARPPEKTLRVQVRGGRHYFTAAEDLPEIHNTGKVDVMVNGVLVPPGRFARTWCVEEAQAFEGQAGFKVKWPEGNPLIE